MSLVLPTYGPIHSERFVSHCDVPNELVALISIVLSHSVTINIKGKFANTDAIAHCHYVWILTFDKCVSSLNVSWIEICWRCTSTTWNALPYAIHCQRRLLTLWNVYLLCVPAMFKLLWFPNDPLMGGFLMGDPFLHVLHAFLIYKFIISKVNYRNNHRRYKCMVPTILNFETVAKIRKSSPKN